MVIHIFWMGDLVFDDAFFNWIEKIKIYVINNRIFPVKIMLTNTGFIYGLGYIHLHNAFSIRFFTYTVLLNIRQHFTWQLFI